MKSGFSVSLSGDGDVIAIGEPEFGDSFGRVRVLSLQSFTKLLQNDNYETHDWRPYGTPYMGIQGTKEFEQLGMSVILSEDGNTLLVTSNKGTHDKPVSDQPVTSFSGELHFLN